MIRIAFAALLLAACAPRPAATESPPDRTAPDGRCDAARAQSLVGRQGDAALGREALERTGARTIRWIRPGQAVTMDYSPDRLNIKLDANDRVEGFNCG
jgi:hypothetical protein